MFLKREQATGERVAGGVREVRGPNGSTAAAGERLLTATEGGLYGWLDGWLYGWWFGTF